MHHIMRLVAMEIENIKNVGYGRLEFSQGKSGSILGFLRTERFRENGSCGLHGTPEVFVVRKADTLSFLSLYQCA